MVGAQLKNFTQTSEYIEQNFPKSGFSRNSLYKLKRDNPETFPRPVKVGKSWYVDPEAVVDFILQNNSSKKKNLTLK